MVHLLAFDLTEVSAGWIDVWLELIYSHAPRAAVVLVGTHADGLGRDALEQVTAELRRRYVEGPKAAAAAVCTTTSAPKSASKLRSTLVKMVQGVGLVREEGEEGRREEGEEGEEGGRREEGRAREEGEALS